MLYFDTVLHLAEDILDQWCEAAHRACSSTFSDMARATLETTEVRVPSSRSERGEAAVTGTWAIAKIVPTQTTPPRTTTARLLLIFRALRVTLYSNLYSAQKFSQKMSSDVVANPQTTTAGESKSARKKKAKAEAATGTAIPAAEKSSSELGTGSSDPAGKTNGAEGTSENAYIRELQKCVDPAFEM